ncbi:class I SAM-dependent methyltransferase [Microlunatus parietis]|uniref:SAM-dependent methyltransferase n=1 Tax=Microlunatus parietis TaxID=682979 RepID=A0A7Y9LEQ1_9ACTN|nr:class I SAM-dependent methyltransferase [Microlunatus parietis]NYE75242.1 SAM-dependent methyltransferase [Microlunatus parietis]
MTTADAEPTRPRPEFPLRPEFAPDLFAGAGEDYARYRDGYPDAMLDEIVGVAGATGDGVLLDLACGTGQVAIPMARRFRTVWAVDQEPDMIKVGAAEAARAGVEIRWTCSSAERLSITDGDLELITVANAFHRLDRRAVARSARGWLRPGGALVIMGSGRIPGEPLPDWESVVRTAIRDWHQSNPPATPTSDQSPPDQRKVSHEDLLVEEGYRVSHRSFVVARERTLDEVIGHVYSRSNSTRRALGPNAADFEADLRQRLLARHPDGRYPEDLGYFYSVAHPITGAA